MGCAHWIIFSVYCEERDFDGKHRIAGRGITVICVFGWVTPAGALYSSIKMSQCWTKDSGSLSVPIELVKVYASLDFFLINVRVVRNFLGMSGHPSISSHGLKGRSGTYLWKSLLILLPMALWYTCNPNQEFFNA